MLVPRLHQLGQFLVQLRVQLAQQRGIYTSPRFLALTVVLASLLERLEQHGGVVLVEEHRDELRVAGSIVLLAELEQLGQLLLLAALRQQDGGAPHAGQLVHGRETIVDVHVVGLVQHAQIALLHDLHDGRHVPAGQLEAETQRGREPGELEALLDVAPGLEDVGGGVVLVGAEQLGPAKRRVDLVGGHEHDEAQRGVREREGDELGGGRGEEEMALEDGEEGERRGREQLDGRQQRVLLGGEDGLVGVDRGQQRGVRGQRGVVAQRVGRHRPPVQQQQQQRFGGGEEDRVHRGERRLHGVVGDGEQLHGGLDAIAAAQRERERAYIAVLSW